MPNKIREKITALETFIKPWDATTAPSIVHKSTTLVGLKALLTSCFLTLKNEFSTSEVSAVTGEIEGILDVIQQHIPSYNNQSYFNQCVVSSFELFKLLHAFGYMNNRVDKIIKSSLSNRKEAQKAFAETVKTSNEIRIVKSEVDEYKSQIEEFYEKCFGDDDGSYNNKISNIDDAFTKVCDEDGLLEKVEVATKEVEEYRDEILEYKKDLLVGDSENESLKQQIHELNQEMLANQKKMQTFIQDYITGATIVTEDKDGIQKVTKITSKKELVDDLHQIFQKHIDTEKEKIAEYISAFDVYKKAKELEIEGLLKNATNASLASAFEMFRVETEKLKNQSEKYFFWAMLALVTAIFIPYIPCIKEWMFESTDIYINLLKRFLFTGPFIWMAYHLSRKTNQYFRLEQEYAHKAVVSRSFEGYKSQVLELYKDNPASNAMLEKLLTGSIDTISKNPAEVLDSVKATNHPMQDIKENLTGIIDPITKLIDSVKNK